MFTERLSSPYKVKVSSPLTSERFGASQLWHRFCTIRRYACASIAALATLLAALSVGFAAFANPASASSVGLFFASAVTNPRDCVGTAQAGGGELPVTVKVDNSVTGVNYTLYDPQTHMPLNAGKPTPTFAGDSNGEVTATIPVDLVDQGSNTISIVVSDVTSYMPTDTLTLQYPACQDPYFTPYYRTAVTYSNIARTGAQCDKLSFDYSVVADRASGDTRQFYIYNYSNEYASTVQNIVGATSSGGTDPGRNYTGSASVPVDSNFSPSNQESLEVRTPAPDLQYVTGGNVDIPACTPTPPPPVNNPPVANPDTETATTAQNSTFDVTANDTDPNGNTVSITSVTQPANGSVSIGNTGLVTYQSNAGFTGQDSFTYNISDGNGGTATGTVTVTVNAPPPPPNNNPVANSDVVTTAYNTAITANVTANDTDQENNNLTVSSVTQPAHGTASVSNASSVTYAPVSGFVGQDSFTYNISDGNGGTATGTVTVTVNAPPPPPNKAPVAVLTTDVSGGEAPQVIHASGAKSSDDRKVVKYVFAWGDGVSNTLAGSTVAHNYTKPGHYTLSLTVYDGSNASSKTSKTISITAPPRTPRISYHETLATAKLALARIHVKCGNTVYPRGHGATPPRGYKYVVAAFARQTHDSRGYHYYVLKAGQPIPKGSVVAIVLRLVRA